MVSMEKPRSAEKTRPRKRSSVLNCNSVVEKTQTVDPPQWASTIHRHATQTFGARPRPKYPSANREIAEQNTQPQPSIGVAGPARGEQRSHDGANAARPQQQAHTQHGATLWIDSAQMYVEILLSHDGKEHPTGPDHELAGFGEYRGQQSAVSTNIAHALHHRRKINRVTQAQRCGCLGMRFVQNSSRESGSPTPEMRARSARTRHRVPATRLRLRRRTRQSAD